ncbi:DEKNAAC102315 [Brettanomyces naardenensis]|uniref:Autophagy-related protein 3 n=1 Tax=Brettanomyces naardenensis TaxID=13370 RepID=A0A448YK76_BRENA|nr:DEKNAAC102315 [Brettanomyces naardenensis]
MASEYVKSTFRSWREYLTPVTHTSTFALTGEITPEEFVQAGDYLVYKFPTWQWSPAPALLKRDFLPEDKQFLVTRHVPSYVRASDYEKGESTDSFDEYEDNLSSGDAWTSTNTKALHRHCTPENERRHSIEYAGMKESTGTVGVHSAAQSIRTHSSGGSNTSLSVGEISPVDDEDEDYVNDIDELIDDDAEEAIEDERRYKENLHGEIVNDPKKRSYDLYITYSTAYRVPKMFMVGFDSNGTPLAPEKMFEDIASDYRHKTVTIEKAPFLTNTTAVSIHPCRHATVMKALMKMAAQALKHKKARKEQKDIVKGLSKLGLADAPQDNREALEEEEWESLHGNAETGDAAGSETPQESVIRVDQYLVIFLKFMASVTPGIEHDYTMSL